MHGSLCLFSGHCCDVSTRGQGSSPTGAIRCQPQPVHQDRHHTQPRVLEVLLVGPDIPGGRQSLGTHDCLRPITQPHPFWSAHLPAFKPTNPGGGGLILSRRISRSPEGPIFGLTSTLCSDWVDLYGLVLAQICSPLRRGDRRGGV